MVGPGEGVRDDQGREFQLSQNFETLTAEDLFRVVPLKFEPYEEAGHIQPHHVSQPPKASEWPLMIDGDASAVWIGSRYYFHPHEGFETIGEESASGNNNHRSNIIALMTAGSGDTLGDDDRSFSSTLQYEDDHHLESVSTLIRLAKQVREEADHHRSLEWLDFTEDDEALTAIDALIGHLQARDVADHQARLAVINGALETDPSRMMVGVDVGDRIGDDFGLLELKALELESHDGTVYPVPIVKGINGKVGLLPEATSTLGRIYFEATPEVASWIKGHGPDPNSRTVQSQSKAAA